MKPSVFFGHGYHLKFTKSSQFFLDIIKTAYPSLKIYDSRWAWAVLPSKSWDTVVFWQQFPDPALLSGLRANSVVLVPMYDDCPKTQEFWDQYQGCKILCFSQALADLLQPWGHQVLRVQYYPPVPEKSVSWEDLPTRAFFWPRKENLGWPTIRNLLGTYPWKSLGLHVTEKAEVFTQELTQEDRIRYSITQTNWFPNPEAYRKALLEFQVFFAPRREEGIGMSFLEAMALGMAVISVDAPTMNEYIQSGVNGWLYDPDNSSPVPWDQAKSWGLAARRATEEGRFRWEQTIPPILSFIKEPGTQFDSPTQDPVFLSTYKAQRRAYLLFLSWAPLRWVSRLARKLKTLIQGKSL